MTTNNRKFYASNAINHHPSCFPSVFDVLALALSEVASIHPAHTGSHDARVLRDEAQRAFDEVDWIEPEVDVDTPISHAYVTVLHAYAMSLGIVPTQENEYALA